MQRKGIRRIGLVAIMLSFALYAGPAAAAMIPHFTASSSTGTASIGNPNNWGSYDATRNSVAFELSFEYHSATALNALLEVGGNGAGSAIVLNNGSLHFFAGNDRTDVITGSMGLAADGSLVTMVAYLGLNGSGVDDYQMFLNGTLIASSSAIEAGNDWGGSNGSGLGMPVNKKRYGNTQLFDQNDVTDYAGNISVNVYDASLPEFDMDELVLSVPEPSSFLLLGLGLGGLALRRRRA